MKYFVDTNVFLDLIVDDGGDRFGESLKFLNRAKLGEIKILTSALVLAELVWVLQSFYKMERAEIARAMKSTMNIPSLKFLKRDDWKTALECFVNKKVKYIDAVIASIDSVADGRVVIVSYDREFDKLGVKRLEPGEV